MGKLYVRVDDRLIHGQIITSWGHTLSIRQIIAVDDELAQNPMLQSIMTMGVSAHYNPQIVTVDDARILLERDSDKNRLVIVRYCHMLGPLREQIRKAEHINLGNSSKMPDAIYQIARGAGWYIYLSQADADVLRIEAEEDGVAVISQQLPQEKKLEWPAMKKEIGL